MPEELVFPVAFILIWTIIVSIGYLIFHLRRERKYYTKIIDKLKRNKGKWEDPNHPIISGEGGSGWQDPNHPIMR